MLGPENGDASALDFELEYVAVARSYWKNLTPGLPTTILMDHRLERGAIRSANAAKTCRAYRIPLRLGRDNSELEWREHALKTASFLPRLKGG